MKIFRGARQQAALRQSPAKLQSPVNHRSRKGNTCVRGFAFGVVLGKLLAFSIRSAEDVALWRHHQVAEVLSKTQPRRKQRRAMFPLPTLTRCVLPALESQKYCQGRPG